MKEFMGHNCNSHHETEEHHGRTFLFTIAIAFFFMLVEIVGGILGKSLALMGDALHLFADVGALSLGWVVTLLLRRPATKSLSYGFQRAEILGALSSALLLCALCGVLAFEAIRRLFHPEEVRGGLVFIVAAIGLFANILMIKLLHSSKEHNLNMRAAYLHVLGDLLGSLGVLLSGAIIWYTGWNLADPIVTLLFAVGIVYGAIKIIWESVCILMEASPPGINADEVFAALKALPNVEEVHDLHIWSLSSKQHALSVHLVAKEPKSCLNQTHKILEEKFGIHHMTVQIEDHAHFDPKYCYDCKQKT